MPDDRLRAHAAIGSPRQNRPVARLHNALMTVRCLPRRRLRDEGESELAACNHGPVEIVGGRFRRVPSCALPEPE